MTDRFRKDDPDAAEKAAAIYAQARGWNGGVSDNISRALQAVLDAIEQPRLPTRAFVGLGWATDEEHSERSPGTSSEKRRPEGKSVELRPTRSQVEKQVRVWLKIQGFHANLERNLAAKFVHMGWATEDPEPEVDPAQVEALAQLLYNALADPDPTPDCDLERPIARRLLASGRVQVTPQ